MRARIAVLVSMCWAGMATASAAESEGTNPEDLLPERVSTSAQSTRGIYQVEAAGSLPFGKLVVGVSTSAFSSRNLISKGDRHERIAAREYLAFSPFGPVDIGISWASTSNAHSPLLPDPTQALGDAIGFVKATHVFGGRFGFGGEAVAEIPAKDNGSVLELRGTTVTGLLIASLHFRPIVIALNAGYRLDNSSKVFHSGFVPSYDTVMRFNGNISKTSAIVANLGVEGRLDVGERLSVLPFIEGTSRFGERVSMNENPIAVSAGIKSLLLRGGLLKIGLGGTLRLSGAPRIDGKFPGLPPWEVFAQLGLNLPIAEPTAFVVPECPMVVACGPHGACAAGLTCSDGQCVMVKDRVIEKEVIKQLSIPTPTFIVAGVITDTVSNEPVRNSIIHLSGYDQTPIAGSSRGEFRTWPLPVDEGILQISVEAEGFDPATQTVAKGPPGTVTNLALKLAPTGGKLPPGRVRGQVTDARSGDPVRATIVLPKAKQQLKAGVEGTFELTVGSGNYDVVITSPKHQAQKIRITVGSGEVVILNIDLTPKRR